MLLIDTHVHLYECFDPGDFFDAAHANFREQAGLLNGSPGWIGILCLVERSHQAWMERLLGAAASARVTSSMVLGSWSVVRTAEMDSLWLESHNGRRLALLDGGQMVTSEGLEVLGLACGQRLPDGLELNECLNELGQRGALPVIPWGFGKWMGRRGKVLRRHLLDAVDRRPFFLGDNGGRPAFLGGGRIFKTARRMGIPVLPGSDSLPLPWDGARVGGFGLAVTGEIDERRPAEALRGILSNPGLSFVPFGKPVSARCFLRNQLMLRLSKNR